MNSVSGNNAELLGSMDSVSGNNAELPDYTQQLEQILDNQQQQAAELQAYTEQCWQRIDEHNAILQDCAVMVSIMLGLIVGMLLIYGFWHGRK